MLVYKIIFLVLQELHFQTPSACFEPISNTQLEAATSLSTGSAFLILFLIFILCYFCGGMIALRLFKGAEGREMIPNYDFWADLPYLVRVSMFSNLYKKYLS